MLSPLPASINISVCVTPSQSSSSIVIFFLFIFLFCLAGPLTFLEKILSAVLYVYKLRFFFVPLFSVFGFPSFFYFVFLRSFVKTVHSLIPRFNFIFPRFLILLRTPSPRSPSYVHMKPRNRFVQATCNHFKQRT